MKTAHEDVLSLLSRHPGTWDEHTGWQFTLRGRPHWHGTERRRDRVTARTVGLALGFEKLGDAHVGTQYLAFMGVCAALCERVLVDRVHRQGDPR